jgi:hypothetical protein
MIPQTPDASQSPAPEPGDDDVTPCPLHPDEPTTDDDACQVCGLTASDWRDPTSRSMARIGRKSQDREREMAGNIAQYIVNSGADPIPDSVLLNLKLLAVRPGRAIPLLEKIGEDDAPRLGLLLGELAARAMKCNEYERNSAAPMTGKWPHGLGAYEDGTPMTETPDDHQEPNP